MSEPKPLIESKDSKMNTFIKRIKPKKMNIFKRMKFFGKKKNNTKNTYISNDELINEEPEIFEYQDYYLEESWSNQMSLIKTEDSKMESSNKKQNQRK